MNKLAIFCMALFIFCRCAYDNKEKDIKEHFTVINTSTEDSINNRKEAIRKLIKRLGVVKLPFKEEYESFGKSKYSEYGISGKDSIFKQIPLYNPNLLLIGLLPDTSKYYQFLDYYDSDSGGLYPAVITFDKDSGKMLTNNVLGDISCGFFLCNSHIESITIEKNLHFKKEIRCMILENGKLTIRDHIYQIGKISGDKISCKDSVIVGNFLH